MYENKTVPDKIESVIELKALLLILSCSILFGIYLLISENAETISNIIYFICPLSVSIGSILLARLYWDSEIFYRSYIALGIGFSMWVAGEVTGHIYQTTQIEELKFVIKIFYLSFFPFAIYHIQKNIRYFCSYKISKIKIIGLILFPMIISFYFYFDVSGAKDENLYDIFNSLTIFMSIIIVELSALGIYILRKNILKSTWQIITMGLLLNAIADIWYLYEVQILLNNFELIHVYNVFWVTSFMLIIYALIKHQKVL